MLDVKKALNDFKPIDLKTVEDRSGKLPENIVEAINLYNKALEDAQFKSEDMAIIALKKAVSLHPVFYEAMNLLGVCYVMVGKEDAAKSVFQKVIDADDSSIKAMSYLKKLQNPDYSDEMDSDTQVRKSKDKGKKNSFLSSLAKGVMPENSKYYYLKYIVGFVAGVIVTSVIWCAVPANKALFTVKKVETVNKDPELEQEIAMLNEKVKDLEQDLQERKDENLKLIDELQSYKEWVARLNQADKEYRDGNYIASADLLYNSGGVSVPEDLYDEYKSLWDKVRLAAAEQLYLEGNKIYNGNRSKDSEVYKQALEKYETSITYLEDDRVSFMPKLYYQAGKAAARCNETERAIELFEFVVNEYPDTSTSSYASARLNEVRAGQEISGS